MGQNSSYPPGFGAPSPIHIVSYSVYKTATNSSSSSCLPVNPHYHRRWRRRRMTTKPIAVFIAFGTKGDVYPIAAIAAAFASDQNHYRVAFVTHSAHELFFKSLKWFHHTSIGVLLKEKLEKPIKFDLPQKIKNLKRHLGTKGVAYFTVSSPPVLSPYQDNDAEGSTGVSFSFQKREVTRKHRQELLSIVEGIYGEGPSTDGGLIIINFFALEGWSLAELFHVRCVVAAPYVVPYSAPSSFERQFKKELPLLYKYLKEAPICKIGWEDVIHWMWPLFTEDWGMWRSHDLQLSFWPFTDPVTGLPTWHDRPSSPLLLYGFSQEVVECPGYWPSRARVCGFWFLPVEWQFSCDRCSEISSLISLKKLNTLDELCSNHSKLKLFLDRRTEQPVFISLSSVGSMGYLSNPQAFLHVLRNALNLSSYRFILFTAGYGPLDAAIKILAEESSSASERIQSIRDQICLFGGRLFCFSGNVPYEWLFPRCAVAIHHGGSGTTAAALRTGIPQVICPFILDQFYWAERMFWLGVAPEPLNSTCMLPEQNDDKLILKAANVLVGAINYALSPELKLHASHIAERISLEDGVSTAVKLIEELNCIKN